MNVVLVLPGNGVRLSTPTSLAGAEHLGLGSIAAYLRKHGQNVTILNFQVQESCHANPITATHSVDTLLSHDPDIIGVSITGSTINQALDLCRDIKARQPDLHICWGSHQASSCAVDILANEPVVDTIIAGDGEIPMLELIRVIENNGTFSQVPGLWYRHNGTVILSSTPPEPSLGSLSWPARDTLSYLQDQGILLNDARISTSRGCPFSCSFCVYPALGYLKRWRARTPSDIIAEIKQLHGDYCINHFWFSDDNFLLPTKKSLQRVVELAERLIEENLNITYRVLMRADAVDCRRELLTKLAQSGMTCLYMGIESGSPRRLKYLKKKTDVSLYRRAIKLVRDHAIGLQIGFIMFDPMTGWLDLEEDCRFLHETEEMYLYTNYCQGLLAYPGTPIAATLMAKGLLPQNFNYQSKYQDYTYEVPDIGRLAAVIESCNNSEQIALDNFFRRLRMIDVPGLFRSHDRKTVEKIHGQVESVIHDLNDQSFVMFNSLLKAARASSDSGVLRSILQEHQGTAHRSGEKLLALLLSYPAELTQALSAIKGLDTDFSYDSEQGRVMLDLIHERFPGPH